MSNKPADQSTRKHEDDKEEKKGSKASGQNAPTGAGDSSQQSADNNQVSNSQQVNRNNNESNQEASPPRRPRPIRPRNMRPPRQVVLTPVGASIARGEPVAMGVPALAAQFELVSTAGGARRAVLAPPKRPAHLPNRFHAYHPNSANSMQTSLGAVASSGSASKPNRYSWAQMQQWQAAAAAAAAAREDPTQPAGHLDEQSAQQQQQQQRVGGFHYHFASPFASAASRVLVVNPIVNLSEHTKSRLVKTIEAVKRFSEKWFSHVLLLLFLAVYACLGAYIFISFEANTEQTEKQLVMDFRARIVNESFDQAHANEREQYNDLFRRKLEDYERMLNRIYASGLTSSSTENQWTFWGALFYSMTVFTTIGYGHLTPITFAGRVATMIYAIFGIPILLMVLADLGKLLTRIIKFAFKKFRSLYNKLLRRKESVRTRKMISDNTNQYIGLARGAMQRGFAAYIQPYQQRIPNAFRNTFSRGGGRSGQKRAAAGAVDSELGEIIPSADDDKLRSAGNVVESSEVIVTPGKQTKPVSPQPGQNSSKKSPLSLANNQQHHSHQHHNHHQRALLPGSQSSAGSARRKISTSNKNAAIHDKKKANTQPISRSSSSSAIGSSADTNKLTKQNQKQQRNASKRSSSSDETSELKSIQANQAAEQQQQQTGEITSNTKPSEADLNSPGEANNDNKLTSQQLDDLEQQQQQDDQFQHDEDPEDEDDFDIPVSFALFLLITYMMFGAVVFSIWEGWNFFDALYFVFISMSTIGFGDLVPQHPKRMIGTFAYLLFGLALTSMCINVVQEKIHATFLRAKMQIGEKMGFDLDQIMADDYYNDAGGSAYGDDHDDYYQEDQECDSNSVAVSQTNSSLANENETKLSSHATEQQLSSRRPATLGVEGAAAELNSQQASKSSWGSAKNKWTKKRGSGSDGGGGGSSFRRKSSTNKKPMSRQVTPNENAPTPSGQAAKVIQPTTTNKSAQQQQHSKPIESQLDVIDNRADRQVIVINQPTGTFQAICEPLRKKPEPASDDQVADSERQPRPKLISTRSQPSPQPSTRTQRSLSSSRRASVSHELSQLDDIIVALSRAPSSSSKERFGPLLGIPATTTRKSSLARSSNGTIESSSNNLLNNSNSSSGSINSRRATSMLNRSATSSPRPAMDKKRSFAGHTPIQLTANNLSPSYSARQPLNLSESQAALDELEAIKFSAI